MNSEKILNTEFDEVFGIAMDCKLSGLIDDYLNIKIKELAMLNFMNDKKTIFVEAKLSEKDKAINYFTEESVSFIKENLKIRYPGIEYHIENEGREILINFRNPVISFAENLQIIIKSSVNDDFSYLTFTYKGKSRDDKDGAVIFRLIINLMKDIGINPDSIRIGILKDNTTASLAIPIK